MPTHYFPPIRRTPASGVAPRRVPSQMAPERCVTVADSVCPDVVQLIGRDLSGVIRIRIEIARADASPWLIRVIRHWLAWAHNATEIRIVR